MGNYILVYLICFLIFVAWLYYEQRKRQKMMQKASDDFWAREEEANSTRLKDISHLPLIQIDPAELPAPDTTDASVLLYVGKLREAIQNPMIDLSEYSNTDLKLAYGVGNFKTLSDYDENFSNFLLILTNLARTCAQAGLDADARDCYETALRYGSRKASDYEELAQTYLRLDCPELVSQLIADLDQSDYPRKNTLIEKLKDVLATYQ